MALAYSLAVLALICWHGRTLAQVAQPLELVVSTGRNSMVQCVAYSGDGKCFATGSADGKVIL